MVVLIKEGEVSLSANGSDTLSFDVSAGKRYIVKEITFDSTGTFKITDIRDSSTGQHYLSGSLHSSLMKNKANVNLLVLDPPIELAGATKLIFDITDTSGSSNTVKICLYGEEQ